ncbi:hypothetical protein K3769_24660 [Streptomyces sp. A15ISP2-DRY2]|uniref:Lipoprotein CseA n=1 Tax=Streptomyces ortus TaxID=2867268 RepID=A0ABT3VB80_9ACTN|nr:MULTISPECIES: hypothetical protein [Streptomyces]MCX4235905.1 hypothetical protein [Streptomyces ortus]
MITAAAVLAALGLSVSACGTGGTGARDEGPALSDSAAGSARDAAPSASAPASATPDRVNAVRLVRSDPGVSTAVKRDLKPCVGDEYPVDVSYGNLTGGSRADVVINVMTCGDAVGVGSYVYREEGDGYKNVFRAEEPPVYAEIDRGDLVITQQVYERNDSVTYPSGEEVITYHWTATRFTERARTHNDYSKVVGGESAAPTDQ